MKSYISYLLVAGCVLMISTGQILFKIVGIRLRGAATVSQITMSYSTIGLLLLSFGIYAVGTSLWIGALATLPLTRAYMFMAGAFILVPLAAHLFLGEPLTFRILLGGVIVGVGIWVAVTGQPSGT